MFVRSAVEWQDMFTVKKIAPINREAMWTYFMIFPFYHGIRAIGYDLL